MYKIVIDTNLWVSLLISKRLKKLKDLCLNKDVVIVSSHKIVEEYLDVSSRTKVRKYIQDEESIFIIFDIIKKYCVADPVDNVVMPEFKDQDDLYLLALSAAVGANFLLTGDKDLLALGKYEQTEIVSFSKFMEILEES